MDMGYDVPRIISPIEELKSLVIKEVDTHREQLSELSRKIHANPELGFQETKAVGWLTQCLEGNGFVIERGICGLPTAFRARYGEGKPSLALLAEYDALPDLGHACGHNLIAGCAVGAALAAKLAIDCSGGSLWVIGTPAEELYGGKVIMANRGAFRDLDAALIAHPDTHDVATIRALACQALKVEFFGKAAHAAVLPEVGINALEAMLESFNAINSLRQHIKPTARIHGIITDGGQAANIIPTHSAGHFLVRAAEDSYLDELKERVLNCFIGAATATGARLQYAWDEVRYATMRNSFSLARLYTQNMRSLGHKVVFSEPDYSFGSTDMGNVSHLVPSIHPFIGIAERGLSVHTPEFVTVAASENGIKGMLDAAKALAMVVVDLVTNPGMVSRIREEFRQGKR